MTTDIREIKMKILSKSELSVVVDVDGTLVDTVSENTTGVMAIPNPYQTGDFLLRKPKKGNIGLLKDFKGRGYTVTVWSHGGALYAAQVVKYLNLESYVDFVSCKPTKCVDNKADIESIVGMRVFIDE